MVLGLAVQAASVHPSRRCHLYPHFPLALLRRLLQAVALASPVRSRQRHLARPTKVRPHWVPEHWVPEHWVPEHWEEAAILPWATDLLLALPVAEALTTSAAAVVRRRPAVRRPDHRTPCHPTRPRSRAERCIDSWRVHGISPLEPTVHGSLAASDERWRSMPDDILGIEYGALDTRPLVIPVAR